MRKTIAISLVIMMAFAAQAEILTGSAKVNVKGGGNVVFPEQDGTYSGVRVVAQMRENNPTIMDVTYIVYTNPETTPTVNVRALAFENGERSFATVVRPETFIDGTEVNIGDGIDANLEHKLSWRVSSDWATDLAKVSFEVLAVNSGDWLLPGMHFVTIPTKNGIPKTIVSVNNMEAYRYKIGNAHSCGYSRWNTSSSASVVIGNLPILNALFWQFASKDPTLILDNGVLFQGTKELVRYQAFECSYYHTYSDNWDDVFGHPDWTVIQNALTYIFERSGYQTLGNNDQLKWINENTRLNLNPSRFRQYAVKTVDE